MRTLFLFFLLIMSYELISQDTLKSIRLTFGSKAKTIHTTDNIQIHIDSIPIVNGYLNRIVCGHFLYLLHDTIALQPEYIKFDSSNATLSGKRYLSFPPRWDTTIKTNIRDINRIVYERQKFPKIMRYSFFASVLTALVISPLVSIEKGGFNHDRFKTISSISGGTAFLTLIFGLVSHEKYYELIPSNKKKRVWTIQK